MATNKRTAAETCTETLTDVKILLAYLAQRIEQTEGKGENLTWCDAGDLQHARELLAQTASFCGRLNCDGTMAILRKVRACGA
jgi:hypothetical protein